MSKKPIYKDYYQQLHEMADRLASYKTYPGIRQWDALRGDRRPYTRELTPSRTGISPMSRDLNAMNWQPTTGQAS